MPWHQVGDGECVSSIAFEAGLLPDTTWLHPDNADLRFKRTPDTLMKGDRLFVPDKRIHNESAGTDTRHRFRRKAVPDVLRVVLEEQDGEPRDNVSWVVVDDSQHEHEGTTGDDGLIEVPISPGAKQCKVYVLPDEEDTGIAEGEISQAEWEDPPDKSDEVDQDSDTTSDEQTEDDDDEEDDETSHPYGAEEVYVFDLGSLDPVSEPCGVQQRLQNLGYDCGNDDGSLGPRTQEALCAFQQDEGLEETGEADEATRQALADRNHD